MFNILFEYIDCSVLMEYFSEFRWIFQSNKCIYSNIWSFISMSLIELFYLFSQ